MDLFTYNRITACLFDHWWGQHLNFVECIFIGLEHELIELFSLLLGWIVWFWGLFVQKGAEDVLYLLLYSLDSFFQLKSLEKNAVFNRIQTESILIHEITDEFIRLRHRLHLLNRLIKRQAFLNDLIHLDPDKFKLHLDSPTNILFNPTFLTRQPFPPLTFGQPTNLL